MRRKQKLPVLTVTETKLQTKKTWWEAGGKTTRQRHETQNTNQRTKQTIKQNTF